MGFYIDQEDSDFEIVSGKKPLAKNALVNLRTSQKWRDQPVTDTLEEELREWYWEAESNENGDLVSIWYSGEKTCDEEEVLKTLAPFVTSGSFIDFAGEDHSHWRYYFDGQSVEYFPGEITFSGCPKTRREK